MASKRILLERIYEDQHVPGYRVLVDRLWPRGVVKDGAELDEWAKELTPSPKLRQWFGHRPERWEEFKKQYRGELSTRRDAAKELLQRSGRKPVVLVYGAKDKQHTHALVLQKYLQGIADKSAT